MDDGILTARGPSQRRDTSCHITVQTGCNVVPVAPPPPIGLLCNNKEKIEGIPIEIIDIWSLENMNVSFKFL